MPPHPQVEMSSTMTPPQVLSEADKDPMWFYALVLVAGSTYAHNRSLVESHRRANKLRKETDKALLAEFLSEDPAPVDPVIAHAHKAAMFVKNDPVAKLISSMSDPVIRYQEAALNLRKAEAEFHAAKAAMIGPVKFIPLSDEDFLGEAVDEALGVTSARNLIERSFADM